MNPILVTTSSFSQETAPSGLSLENLGVRLIKNPFGRTLTECELRDWLHEHKPKGVIAGLEKFSSTVLYDARHYLKVISRVGTGIDNIDMGTAEKYGISVYRTQDAVTPAVVELAMGLIFDLSRRISFHDRLLRQGTWQKHYGTLISGKKFGVLGCGRVGKRMCLNMRALGSDVQAFDSFIDDTWFVERDVKRVSSLEELVATSDVLSIHVPFASDTENLITAELLNKTKPGAFLINTSRGGIVDEDALCEALKCGKLAGAALDVFGQEPYRGPLMALENVVLTPHIGSYAKETRAEMEQEALANLIHGLVGA